MYAVLRIKIGIHVYPTLYKELDNNIGTFCDDIINQAVVICYIVYVCEYTVCMQIKLDIIYCIALQ